MGVVILLIVLAIASYFLFFANKPVPIEQVQGKGFEMFKVENKAVKDKATALYGQGLCYNSNF